ncbi:MAG: hypothetical protein ACREL1_03205 [bacterium]
MIEPNDKRDSAIWFFYIYGGFVLVAFLVYLGKSGKLPEKLSLILAMIFSIAWLCLVIYHFFKKRPKKTLPPSGPPSA